MLRGVSMSKFKLYIKTGEDYLRYGVGDMRYIRELLYDYLVKNDMYNANRVDFRIERLNNEGKGI